MPIAERVSVDIAYILYLSERDMDVYNQNGWSSSV